MKINFFKYQGTGNDFVLLDNRKNIYSSLTTDQIRRLCDRRFGIGADGLMTLNEKPGYDFEMKYYNADGREGSMCGNGGRCLIKFAYSLGIHRDLYRFVASDGDHEAEIDTDRYSNIEGITFIKTVIFCRCFNDDQSHIIFFFKP